MAIGPSSTRPSSAQDTLTRLHKSSPPARLRWRRSNGSTEQEQFTEKTPVFTEAEIHHVAGDDVVRVAPAPRWVGVAQGQVPQVSEP